MMRTLILLALSLVAAAPAQQAERPATDWYGVNIGDLPPPDQNMGEAHAPGEAWDWPNGQPPPPWTNGMVFRDKDARVAEIDLFDSPPIMLDAPRMPRGYVSPPTPVAELRAYMAAGAAARSYAIARLGPPSTIADDRPRREFRQVSLRWDFIDRFVRCEGNTPIFQAAAKEPSGMIASAELEYGPSIVTLKVVGKRDDNAVSDAKDEQDRGARACAPKEAEPDAVGEVRHGIEQFCAQNPDRCVSPVPGLLVVPAPGVTIVPTPCPKQVKHSRCFKGQEIEPTKDDKTGG